MDHRMLSGLADKASMSARLHLQPCRQLAARSWLPRRPHTNMNNWDCLKTAAAEPQASQETYAELLQVLLAAGYSTLKTSTPPVEPKPCVQKAEANTFDPPSGQLQGRSGRRCILEDGERMLDRCIQMRPHDMRARLTLLRNIMLQNMGRERDVPPLAITTLREAGVSDADMTSPAYINILQVVLLGLKALYKQDQRSSVPDFVKAATAAVPGMDPDIRRLADAFVADMASRDDEEQAQLLIKRSYLSCVDLQFVNGRHHVESSALLSVQEP